MDYYKVLGVNKNASNAKIKEAFRKMALQFHPDKHTQSPKHVRDNAILRFRQASDAYQALITQAEYKSSNGSSGGGGGYSKQPHYKSGSGSISGSYQYSKRTDHKSSNGRSGGGYSYNDGKRTDYKSSSGSTSGKNWNQRQSGSRPKSSTSATSKWGFDPLATLQYMTSRPFLRNLAFASVLLGGAVIVKKGGDALSKDQLNHGLKFVRSLDSLICIDAQERILKK